MRSRSSLLLRRRPGLIRNSSLPRILRSKVLTLPSSIRRSSIRRSSTLRSNTRRASTLRNSIRNNIRRRVRRKVHGGRRGISRLRLRRLRRRAIDEAAVR